jgi:hypothetical protein
MWFPTAGDHAIYVNITGGSEMAKKPAKPKAPKKPAKPKTPKKKKP